MLSSRCRGRRNRRLLLLLLLLRPKQLRILMGALCRHAIRHPIGHAVGDSIHHPVRHPVHELLLLPNSRSCCRAYSLLLDNHPTQILHRDLPNLIIGEVWVLGLNIRLNFLKFRRNGGHLMWRNGGTPG